MFFFPMNFDQYLVTDHNILSSEPAHLLIYYFFLIAQSQSHSIHGELLSHSHGHEKHPQSSIDIVTENYRMQKNQKLKKYQKNVIGPHVMPTLSKNALLLFRNVIYAFRLFPSDFIFNDFVILYSTSPEAKMHRFMETVCFFVLSMLIYQCYNSNVSSDILTK